MRNVISFYRAKLNMTGHDLLDELKCDFPEWRIRGSLSKHLGVSWSKYDINSGFHFSKHEPIDVVERAVEWLQKAHEQNSLSPKLRVSRPDDVVLPQAQMREALVKLKQSQDEQRNKV